MATQIDTRKNIGYRGAVDLLACIRMLADNAGEPERFTKLLAAVTAEHARERNPMALIDKNHWSFAIRWREYGRRPGECRDQECARLSRPSSRTACSHEARSLVRGAGGPTG